MLLTILPGLPEAAKADRIQLERIEAIAKLIFRNECAGKKACLTSWNRGEGFASIGIGHFIWYPAGMPESSKRFSESFPGLIHFMRQQGVAVPAWIQENEGCPWPNREIFRNAQKSSKMMNLRSFLFKTMSFQANFMRERLKSALPLMLAHAPEDQRRHIRQQFDRVAGAPMGMYALMDYVNFKGEGVNPKERYGGQGWGLLQVLENMKGAGSGGVIEFASAADALLTRRVNLSPPERHEFRWLAGWRKRLRTYVLETRNGAHALPLE